MGLPFKITSKTREHSGFFTLFALFLRSMLMLICHENATRVVDANANAVGIMALPGASGGDLPTEQVTTLTAFVVRRRRQGSIVSSLLTKMRRDVKRKNFRSKQGMMMLYWHLILAGICTPLLEGL
jgi:hypothetical protein